MHFPSLELESDLPMSLSPDPAPQTSSLKGITDDVLVSVEPPTTLNDFCEFQEGEDLKSASELNMGSLTLSIMR